MSLIGVALLTASVVGQAAAAAADFYVSPQGNDAWSGRLESPNAAQTDGPFATLTKAQQAVRTVRGQQSDRPQPVVVAVRGGTYFLEQTLTFQPADSGTEKSPVIYQAYGDERPIISGGVRLTGWQADDRGRWHTNLPDVKQGKWSFAQLFVNDQRRCRPRSPKKGNHAIADQLPPSPKAQGRGCDQFVYAGDNIRADWANLDDVEVVGFHQWAISRMRIAKIDAAKRTVLFTGNTCSPTGWGAFGKGARYFVDNVREALSEPGEWYLDRPTGELTYVPRPGEQPDQAVVIAPRLEQLVAFVGDVPQKRWVQHVQLRGLTFAHSNWVLPKEGQAFPQAEIGLNAAVAAVGTRHIAIDTCAIRHVGAYAMAFGIGSQHNRIENCELFDMAGGGIKIGHAGPGQWSDTGQVPSDPEHLVSHHAVRNCLMVHGGRLHPAAVGVWIGHSPHNVVQHNQISDFYYTAVSVGWIWGYSPSQAHHNDIGFNHMHTIGQGVLSDMGGVYTLGTSPGTVVHDNHIHDVQSFDYGGWGLYTDEGSTGIVMEKNLVYRCKTGSFHQHYGKENRIQNNIFVCARDQQLQRTRTEPHLSFWLERNIIYWKTGPLLGSNWNDNNFKLDRNVYWNAAGQPVQFFGGLTLDQWREKRDQDRNSIIADPRFVAPDKDDFRLQPDSPALKVGFQPLDAAKAGRLTPPVFTAKLPSVPPGF
jgi:hypothetical protein